MTELDHVLWAAADLDDGVRSLAARTGLDPVPGGSHAGWGTRNALVGLGGTYLEVLATDPAQDGGWLADEVRALPGPTLHRWALRTDELDAVVARLRAAGLRGEARDMSRATPAGDVLRWRIAFVEGHGLGTVVPFLIDWLDTPHPTTSLGTQGALHGVDVLHPQADRVRELLALVGAGVTVLPAERPGLRASLDTPQGPVVLDGVADG